MSTSRTLELSSPWQGVVDRLATGRMLQINQIELSSKPVRVGDPEEAQTHA